MNENDRFGQSKEPSLEEIKNRSINILTNAFTGSHISVETFELALTNIEKASSIEDIRNTVREFHLDDKELVKNTFEDLNEREKITSHGSSKLIGNKTLMTKRLEIEITHSKIVLDYSNLTLPEGDYEIVFNAVHSKCEILMPADVVVENRINEIYSSVKDARNILGSAPAKISFKFLGNMIHSKIKIIKPKRHKTLIEKR